MSNIFKKISSKIVKHSPEILMGIGVTSIIAGVVIACKVSTKIEKTFEKEKEEINQLAESIEKKEISDKELQQKFVTISSNVVKKGVKLYWLPTILIVGGLSVMLKSNGILKDRNTYLTTSIVCLKEAFDKYKEKVIDKYGIEAHEALLLDSNGEFVTETIIDEETNKKKKIKHAVYSGYLSEYGFVFDESCTAYDKNFSYNLTFIKLAEDWINQKLLANGFVYLDELYRHFGVYDKMNLEEKKKYLALGHTFGWVYKPDNEKMQNYIKINFKDVYLTKDGYDLSEYGCDPILVIDFEPDGPVNYFL